MSNIVRVKIRARSRKKGRPPLVAACESRFPVATRRCLRFIQTVRKSWFLLSLAILTGLAVFVTILSHCSEGFSLLQLNSFSHWLTIVLASLSSIFSFSIAEIFIYCFALFLLFWLVVLVRSFIRKCHHKRVHKSSRRVLWAPLIALLIILDLFLLLLYPAYQRPDIAESFVFSETYTEEDLYTTVDYLVRTLNKDVKSITFLESGESVMPFSFSQTAKDVNALFSITHEQFPFLAGGGLPAKPILLSEPLTQFHISGVYTFFSGEANINTNYPDFILPYSMAHEGAHQRGIGKENDASFVAFVVCSQTQNAYTRYSAYLNTLCTFLNGLESDLANAENAEDAHRVANKVNRICGTLDERIQGELAAYSNFFATYQNSPVSQLSDTINDDYLKTQGQDDGIESYQNIVGLVVHYCVNYLA